VTWWQSLILIASGILMALACFLSGAWVMFKSRSNGQGFLKEPKGEVFSIPDGSSDFPMSGEPGEDEKRILEKTNKFLRAIGGGLE